MERTQGIVIRTADYREKDRLCVIFTPKGAVTVTAKGVRSPTAKLKTAAMTMAFGEFIYGGKNGKAILSGAEIADNFFDAWRDKMKVAAIMTCFELAEKCFDKDGETATEFIELLKTINETVYGQCNPLCTAFKYAVFCAERTGTDYSEIREYDEISYGIIKAFSICETEDVGTMPYTEFGVTRAFGFLVNLISNYLGIKIYSFGTLIKQNDG
mgnify:CR=1 FL=1